MNINYYTTEEGLKDMFGWMEREQPKGAVEELLKQDMNKKINEWRYKALNDHELKQKAVKLPHFQLLQRFEDKLESTKSRDAKKNIVSEAFEWAYNNDYKVFYIELRNLLKERLNRAKNGHNPRVTEKAKAATLEEAKSLFETNETE